MKKIYLFLFPLALLAACNTTSSDQASPHAAHIALTNQVIENNMQGVEGVTPPKLVKYVNPISPRTFRPQTRVIKVTAVAYIDEMGLVTNVEIHDSNSSSYSKCVAQAMIQWEFTPKLINGIPVDFTVIKTYTFRQRP